MSHSARTRSLPSTRLPIVAMGEFSDAWAAAKEPNIWGRFLGDGNAERGRRVGSGSWRASDRRIDHDLHCLSGIASDDPNMFKIAAELTPSVFHVSARTVAAQALSIFGDHSDVMATRTTGFGLIASGSIQEVHDFALIAQAATLEARVPFVHFFDGFRTSHEVQKIEILPDDTMRAMIADELVLQHRARALSPITRSCAVRRRTPTCSSRRVRR